MFTRLISILLTGIAITTLTGALFIGGEKDDR